MAGSRKKGPVFNLILLGDPGAGKATQGKRLVKKYPLREFDMGKWLRSLKDPKLRKKFGVDSRIGKGVLAFAEPTRKKFREVILETPKNKGVFFSGSPKKYSEARTVVKTFKDAGRRDPIVVYIAIPEKEMLERLEGRRERIRGKHYKRSDDSASSLKNRMRYYKKDIKSVVNFFKDRYYFRTIDGVGTEAEVFKRLDNVIQKGLKQQEKQGRNSVK